MTTGHGRTMMSSNRRRREAIISDKRQRPKATASRVKTRESEAAHSDSETDQRRTLRSWTSHEEECEEKERPPRPLWKPSETTQPNVIEPTQTDNTQRSNSKVGSQTTGVQITIIPKSLINPWQCLILFPIVVTLSIVHCGAFVPLCYMAHPLVVPILLYY